MTTGLEMIIIRPNLIRILLGWDGLGLVSYILIVYYQNVKSYLRKHVEWVKFTPFI